MDKNKRDKKDCLTKSLNKTTLPIETMNNKTIVTLLAFLTIVFVTIVIVNTSGNTQCLKQKEVSDELINGKITKVYLDSANHNYETIEMIMDGELRSNYFLLFEKSGLYNHLLPGDSIFKMEKSLKVNVIRGNETKQWTLNYGCKED